MEGNARPRTDDAPGIVGEERRDIEAAGGKLASGRRREEVVETGVANNLEATRDDKWEWSMARFRVWSQVGGSERSDEEWEENKWSDDERAEQDKEGARGE